jgi:tRNA nucleotidyltransferase/poly(A) polymerase
MTSLAELAAALGPDAQLMAVGGCVRDRLLGRPQGDWDLATALRPETVMARAKAAGLKALPTGLQHGTVTVLVKGHPFEITTFRGDGTYSDGRHPDAVTLGVSLREDLARRDFTLNAMALPVEEVDGEGWRVFLVDPFGGEQDLRAGLLRAVGDPLQRFAEDGLRPLRACRFASQLGFDIEAATLAAIPQRLEVAAKVALERVFTELTKLLCGKDPARGLRYLESAGLLDLWLPELRPMVGCLQNRHHRFDVWNHSLEVLRFEKTGRADLRWAALLHDVAKPASRTVDEAGEAHFYVHEFRSVELTEAILRRLKASNQLIQDVKALVRHHGVHPDGNWTGVSYRRHLRKLEQDGLSVEAWIAFRWADQLGKGWEDAAVAPNGLPGRVWAEEVRQKNDELQAKLEAMLGEKPPLSAKDLALDGKDLMSLAGRKGGPWLGELQKSLVEAVLEEPGLNTGADLGRLATEWCQTHS